MGLEKRLSLLFLGKGQLKKQASFKPREEHLGEEFSPVSFPFPSSNMVDLRGCLFQKGREMKLIVWEERESFSPFLSLSCFIGSVQAGELSWESEHDLSTEVKAPKKIKFLLLPCYGSQKKKF